MNAEYLKEAVGKYLCQALCAVAMRRPERPIEFLAYYLISLYEKDLELQRAKEASKKAEEPKEEEEKTQDLSVTPDISQMFERRLTISHTPEAECSSPTPSSSSTVVSEVPPEISHMFKERLSILGSQEKDAITPLPIPSVVLSAESEPSVIPKRSLTSADSRKPSLLKEDKRLELPARKISSLQMPVTEEEAEQFGTTDPFLARRPSSNVFDVNASPIGNL